MVRFSLFPIIYRAVISLTPGCLMLAAVPLQAEQLDLQPDVVVTASRMPQTIDSTLADISVITRDDIEDSGARDVLEVLRLQAGVDIYRTGGPGSQTSLFLRGTNTNQVLVLIDGVHIASANTGALAFEQLPIDSIERIEIVRGPRASYWGSNAIGGVIQIFTRKLEGPSVMLGYGSYGDARGTAGIGHWNGVDGFSVQVGLRHVDGYPATNPGICSGPDDPYCIYNPIDNPYRNANLALRGGYHFGEQVLNATVLRSDSRSSFDQNLTTQGYSDVLEQAAGATLEGPLTDVWEYRLSIGNAREDLLTPAYFSRYWSRGSSLGWQNRFSISDTQTLIAGIDLLHERGGNQDTSTGIDQYAMTRDNRALYGGWQSVFGNLDAEVSARHDDNSQFGGANTGSAAMGWRFNPRWRVWASYGSGFRSPTLNEQFSPGFGGYYAGNPDLDPERSRSGEVALNFEPAPGQQFAINAYRTRVRNLVTFSGPQNRAENVAHAAIDGVEATWNGSVANWTTQAAFTWQDPRDTDTDTQLLRRPNQKFTASIGRQFGSRVHAGVELVAMGRREDVGGVQLGGYVVASLNGQIQLAPAWRLDLRVENLANRDYELAHGYNTPGRSGYVDIVWQPVR